MADGALALRFDATALAAFDLLILRRPGAEDDWDGARIEPARAYERTLDGAARDQLGRTIVAGLPGSEESYTLDRFRAVWAILIPLIILGGIVGGIFTPTEVAAVGSVYGILIGVVVMRTLKIGACPGSYSIPWSCACRSWY